jgi:hypothetical protein
MPRGGKNGTDTIQIQTDIYVSEVRQIPLWLVIQLTCRLNWKTTIPSPLLIGEHTPVLHLLVRNEKMAKRANTLNGVLPLGRIAEGMNPEGWSNTILVLSCTCCSCSSFLDRLPMRGFLYCHCADSP